MKVVSSNSSVKDICAFELLAGQSEIHSQLTIHSRKEKGRADVWEKSNRRFRHGEDGVLRGYPEGCVDTQPNAPTHGNSVYESNIRLAVGSNHVVEAVFEFEEVLARLLAFCSFLIALRERCNVATSAEGPSFAFDHHDIGHLALAPFVQSGDDLAAHASIEGVEFLRTVKGDGAHTTLPAEQHIIFRIVGQLFDIGWREGGIL